MPTYLKVFGLFSVRDVLRAERCGMISGRDAEMHRLRRETRGRYKEWATVSYCRGRSWQTVAGGPGSHEVESNGTEGGCEIRSRVVTFPR